MTPELDGATIAARLAEIRARADAAAAGRPYRLIAVSKGQPIEAIAAAHAAGQRDFGENYPQELVAKARAATELGLRDLRWHFIGHLQTNKIRLVLPWISSLHSLDRPRLLEELVPALRSMPAAANPLPVFLQVNLDGEASKGGVEPAETVEFARETATHGSLSLRGLMCIPAADVGGDTRSAFARLRDLELACRPHTLGELSMGMTADFEAALREGATEIRVGTAIFGERRMRAP